MLQPQYRATFRDRPETVARHYPGPDPHQKPAGFHGRNYLEYGPVTFKPDGPYKDEQWWLERGDYLPKFQESKMASSAPVEKYETHNMNARATMATKGGPNK